MLDKKQPFGHVQGEGCAGAQFYQLGHYYDVEGRYLFSNPGSAPPPGEKLRSMEQADADYQARISVPAPQVAMGAPAAAAPTPALDPVDPLLTREQQLNQFAVPKLQQLMLVTLKALHPDTDETTLKKQIIGGPGSKAKLIEWLLTNSE